MSILWVPVRSSCVRVPVAIKMPVDNNNCMDSPQPGGIKLNALGHGSSASCTEKAELVGKVHRLKPEQGHRYQVTTLVVAWVSIVVTLVLGIMAAVFSASEQSTAAFAFGLDALLDTVSSLVVVWRFTGRSGSLYSARREKWACTVIGGLFIVAFITITVRSSISIAWVVVPEDNTFLWRLSFANGTICAVLAMAKFYLGWKLESISVITDGFNSVIGSILAFCTAVSILIFTHDPSVWYLDAVCGIVCGSMLLVYGVWVIHSTRRAL